ncbi:bifunctional dihydropteridine reductase/dihydrofolate reductase TmpR [Deinococcus pimensis]|uniref:bifunctional dihydropteridine reductase/dihydrofolate reductase TmpR n=1 Tax=Deinococcus pimensis TaxID=309888 RepID=UPI0004B4163F|nr:bifunctional dihydropteridine reductase/dihydrofolate reductase TmpR [Deinococcus pimensis]
MSAAEGGRRTALVTGASGGIGRGVALALAREGFDVAVHYRRSREGAEETARLARTFGVDALTVQGDVTDPEAAARIVREAHAAFRGLGVLVNNVGNYVHKPWIETTVEEWRDMLDSNLSATFYTCREAVPLMRAAGWGRVVNLGYAGAQHLVARPGIVPYAVAKSGVIVLTRAIAKSEAGTGVSANVVSPGVIETSVSQPLREIPAGRLGTVEELTDAVLTFVRASDYVTGQVLEVAGGWNL